MLELVKTCFIFLFFCFCLVFFRGRIEFVSLFYGALV